MKTLKQFAVNNHLKLQLTRVPFRQDRESINEAWDKEASHWLYRIDVMQGENYGKSAIKGYFSQGSAIKHKPTLEDILNSLSMDTQDLGDFVEWANNYGYDIDSIKANETYKACLEERRMVIGLLGQQGLDELHECETL